MREDGWDVADFFSYPCFQTLRQSLSNKASLAAFSFPDQVSVSFAGRPTVARERPVSGNFLSTLQVYPELGRLLSDNDDRFAAPPTAVVSHRFWTDTLGSPSGIVGRTLIVNNRPHIIVGVLDKSFYGLFPGDPSEVYVPLHDGASLPGGPFARPSLDDNRFWGVQLIARRSPGVRESEIRPILDAVFPTTWSVLHKVPANPPRIRLVGGSRGLGFFLKEFRNPLLVLGGLVTLLLLIACTNIANLLLARAAARQKEVATRISLGCSRARLMRQFLTESALLAALGGAASIVVAYLTANLLGRFIADRGSIPIAVAFDLRILALAGTTTALALLLFGLFPAWHASRLPSAPWLKQTSSTSGPHRKWNTGSLLVVGQMAMSVALVMCAVIFTRNLLAIQSSDPGFDRRDLILFDIRPGTSGYDNSRLQHFYFNLEQRLAALPGVASVGLASMRPMNIGGWWESLGLAGQTAVNQVSVNGVTPTYLSVFTSRLMAGRNIQWTDISSGAKIAVISQDLAQKLGGNSVLGRRLAFSRRSRRREIAAIRNHWHCARYRRNLNEGSPLRRLAAARKGESTSHGSAPHLPAAALVLPIVRRTMSEIDRNLPLVDVMTMEEQISKGLQRERMFATLCNGFGILALVLSVVGLYGVLPITFRAAARKSAFAWPSALCRRRSSPCFSAKVWPWP